MRIAVGSDHRGFAVKCKIVELLRASDAADVLVVAGGVIPDEDLPALRELGVAEVFLQETPPTALVTRVRELVEARTR